MVEDGLYKTNDTKVTTAPVVASLVIDSAITPSTSLESTNLRSHRANDKSPELPVTWQFSRRTALPPRPPSLVS